MLCTHQNRAFEFLNHTQATRGIQTTGPLTIIRGSV